MKYTHSSAFPMLCFDFMHALIHVVTRCSTFPIPQLENSLMETGTKWPLHFADGIIKLIFLNENSWIFIKIWLKFVLGGSLDNMSALIQAVAWCRAGDKSLPEWMLPVHWSICITWRQWVNTPSNKFILEKYICIFYHSTLTCCAVSWDLPSQWCQVISRCSAGCKVTMFISVSSFWIIWFNSKRRHHSRYELSQWEEARHYLNQCWNIVNWIIGNKSQWNLNWNNNFHSRISIWIYPLQNDVHLSQFQYVNH